MIRLEPQAHGAIMSQELIIFEVHKVIMSQEGLVWSGSNLRLMAES